MWLINHGHIGQSTRCWHKISGLWEIVCDPKNGLVHPHIVLHRAQPGKLTLFLSLAENLTFFPHFSSLSDDEMFEPGDLGRGSHIIYWLHKNVRYHHLHYCGHQGIILHIIQQCLHLHAHRCQKYVLERGKQYKIYWNEHVHWTEKFKPELRFLKKQIRCLGWNLSCLQAWNRRLFSEIPCSN